MINKHEIESVLDLQQRTYNLLLWVSEQAKHQPELLSEANLSKFRYAESCEEWVRHKIGIFPARLRPEEEDITAFAHLLSSFFNTSFHVSTAPELSWANAHRWAEHPAPTGARYMILRPGKPKDKHTKKSKEKEEESARHLQLIALEELAIENDLDVPRLQLTELMNQPNIVEDLNLWSYVHELLRRSRFASQGSAVHHMWLSLDKKKRENLNADAIWKARENLIRALSTAAQR